MITIGSDKEKCCGCGACSQICPQKCIVMVRDHEGFLYPEVNEGQCIKCGMCDLVCPIKTYASLEIMGGGTLRHMEDGTKMLTYALTARQAEHLRY